MACHTRSGGAIGAHTVLVTEGTTIHAHYPSSHALKLVAATEYQPQSCRLG